jgi:hypothetical protein
MQSSVDNAAALHLRALTMLRERGPSEALPLLCRVVEMQPGDAAV